MAKKKLQILISSTSTDLRDERQASVEAILKAGHIPAGMELFTAGNDSQWGIIREWIDESDVYMLILGGHYGTADPNTGLSSIELEYDYAVAQGKPCFAVVIRDEALEANVLAKGTAVFDVYEPAKLKAFRTKVLSKTSAFYTDAQDIKLAVLETLAGLIRRHPFTGWISGAEATQEPTAYLEKIQALGRERDVLRLEVEALRRELDALKKKSAEPGASAEPGGKAETSYEVIAEKLIQTTVRTNALSRDPQEREYTVAQLALQHRNVLFSGITEHAAKKDPFLRVLYASVFPSLQTHGFATRARISSGQTRYRLNQRGLDFLKWFESKGRKGPGNHIE